MIEETPLKAQPAAIRPGLQTWLDAWKTCTQNVLSQIAGQPHVFEVSAEPLAPAGSDLRYTIAATGALEGEMALRLSLASAIKLAHKFLGEAIAAPSGAPPGTEPITNDDREALEELLRQVAGLVATAIGDFAGGEVHLQLVNSEAPWAATAERASTLHTRDESGAEIAVELRIGQPLGAALAARGAAASASQSAPAAASALEDAPLPPNAAGYHRLFDVGLNVKLRFGTRRMVLRDILALSTGLVVELDNDLNSPVDLLLDGRVIARGEVVVIDGKYGLRVSEVVEPPPASGAQAG
ncbi:MAG TPA: FliM/FliN family flagellar motor switch protein [Terriglobales bacterium]|nr:FliM/FliN family flagellar motor switch protein [Terriglobales bacterium]